MTIRLNVACVLCLATVVTAQVPGGAAFRWRQSFHGFLGQPPGTFNARDLQQLETDMVLAGRYCTGLNPGDYEANRDLARQMGAYLASIQVASGDLRWNQSLRRMTRSLAVFPCAYAPVGGAQQAPPEPAIPADPGEAPFALKAPDLRNIAPADNETAQDLKGRYNAAAARGATIWKNAEVLRQTLAARGMGLNADTASAVGRLKLDLDSAFDALRDRNWADALANLQKAEYETQKISRVVGT